MGALMLYREIAILIALALLCGSANGQNRTYLTGPLALYVSANGSDANNNCTSASYPYEWFGAFFVAAGALHRLQATGFRTRFWGIAFGA